MALQPVLETEGLTRIFSQRGQPDLTAVNHVSFTLQPRECLGIIGQSGSGKSTLARLITRLIDPSSGVIRLDGQDITSLRGKALRPVYRRMQMVFQSPAESFDPRRTLGDSICEGMRNAGMSSREAEAEAVRLLELCGLERDTLRRYPHQVSGGQCQRAAIARSIALRPALLICDEATSALDVTIQGEVMQLITQLRQELHMACLLITHDIALVQRYCNRVLVMHQGCVAEEGILSEIIRQPSSPWTRQLIENAL